MSKELEVKDLQANFIKCFNELLTKTDKDIIVVNISREMAQDMVNLYEKYLTINPSEALECLEVIGSGREDNMKFREVFEKEYNTILKALLKAQEQEKVLEIIKNKQVNVRRAIILRKDYQDYLENYGFIMAHCEQILSQEEFELVKRWVECQKD